jgi:hypothetical protein
LWSTVQRRTPAPSRTRSSEASAGANRRRSSWAAHFHSPCTSRSDQLGVESLDRFRRVLECEVERREDEAARRLASQGRGFLGVHGLLAQDRFGSPAKEEPRRTLHPRIACLDRLKRLEAIAKLKAFLEAYREAWCEFANGVRDVIFPCGTYWMRVAFGVVCAPAG